MSYIAISIVQRLMRFASSKGIDSQMILKEERVDPSILDDTDNKLPLEDYYRVFDKVLDLAGDPDFGLHMGEQAELGDLSVLGYIMANCRNIGEALERACKYFKLIGTVLNNREIGRLVNNI